MIKLDTDNIYHVSDTRRIIEEALKKGTCYKNNNLNYYNIIAAFDIETSNIKLQISDNIYKDIYIYNYLHGITIRCIDVDIDSFYVPKGIKLSYTKGQALDELYQEINDIFPGYIRDGILSPDEQLRQIINLYIDNTPEDEEKHFSIMYCWQFAIDGKVIFGRTWEELLQLYNIITDYTNKKNRLLVWVHNLNMEFQYIRKLLNWYKVFSISNRKPVYAITEDGIEFRCSYILTNYSLAKLGEQLHKYDIKKLVGNLDYSWFRSPETPMSKDEIAYCINDVLVVSAYIQECIIEEKFISNIPLTATGYCRRYCRNMCLPGNRKKKKEYLSYRAIMKSLQISDPEEYKQLKRAFQGGFTHASCLWSGKTIENMDSIDFTSSYPFVMLSERNFPMSSGKIVKPKDKAELQHYLKYYCCIFDVELEGVTPKYINDNYISISHCTGLIRKSKKREANFIANNGRLVSCDKCVTTITNIDWEVIQKTYNIKKATFHNFRIYKKGYLPKALILAIIKLYQDKTTLKGVEGKEQEYQHAKGLLNSTFGMCCTDISKDLVTYIDDWDVEKADISENLKKYNNSPKRFLFYPWGIFICALARRNLWSGILEFGNDYVYADTDSIKCMNIDKHLKYITEYNNMCSIKLKLMCKHYKIDYEQELLPKTIEGEVKPLGIWDYDGHYDKFKTLGAKRYMGQHGEKILLTVSGVNKKVAVPYMIEKYGLDNIFNAFSKGLTLPEGTTGKLLHRYIDHEQSGTFTDYQGNSYTFVNDPPGIYLEDTSYDFDITQDYINYVKGVQHTK